jgi:hypothetical protein
MAERTGAQVGGGFPAAAGDVWSDGLSDELLLVQARRELQAEQLRRTRAAAAGEAEPGPVLGSYQRPVPAPLVLVVEDEAAALVKAGRVERDEADELLAMVDEALAQYQGLRFPLVRSAPWMTELDVRRERRATARVLRGAIGGAA